MKFGETITKNAHSPWSQYYLEYNALKKLISLLHTTLEMEAVGNAVEHKLVAHKLRSPLFNNKWKYLQPNNDESKISRQEHSPTDPINNLRNSELSTSSTSSNQDVNQSTYSSKTLQHYFEHILNEELKKISNFVRNKRHTLNKECNRLVIKSIKESSRAQKRTRSRSPSKRNTPKKSTTTTNETKTLSPMASLRKKMTSSFLTSPKKTTSKKKAASLTSTTDETKQIQNDTFEKQETLKKQSLMGSTTSSDYDEGGVYFSRSSKAARSTLNKVHHLVSLYATNVRESQHLSTFVELNYTGFFKIL